MCWTNVWMVNADAETAAFRAGMEAELGVARVEANTAIRSSRVRGASTAWTLPALGCDCGSVLGSRDAEPAPDEVPASAWLTWLRSASRDEPSVRWIGVAHLWSPCEIATPTRSRTIGIAALDESTLRALGDGSLLIIRYGSKQRGRAR